MRGWDLERLLVEGDYCGGGGDSLFGWRMRKYFCKCLNPW